MDEAKSTPLYAYTDESGNTGLDIFNLRQPWFHTLTLFAKTDLNETAKDAVARWCGRLGVDEIHAGRLGVGRLELIAPEMTEFIMAERPLFIVTAVEKRHMAPMKFADTVLDSGNNDAASGVHYFLNPMRMRLALDLARHMTPRLERRYLAAFRAQDFAAFSDICNRVESSVTMNMTDPRGRQLLTDALRWASANPRAVLEKQNKRDSPNLVAFSYIIQGLHAFTKGTSLRVKAFIHDEQNEFMTSFKEMYDWLHRIRIDEGDLAHDWSEASSFDCPLTEQCSSNAPALQIVDTMLWLLRRQLLTGATGSHACDALLLPVNLFGTIRVFSKEQFTAANAEMCERLVSTPRSRKQIEAGRDAMYRTEAARVARMNKASR